MGLEEPDIQISRLCYAFISKTMCSVEMIFSKKILIYCYDTKIYKGQNAVLK